MLPMLTPSIVLQVLLALFLLTKQGVASSSGHPIHWNFVGRTTIAVTPKIMCAYSSFPPSGLSVEWIVDTTNSEKYRLEAVPSVDAEIVRKRSQMVRFGVDRIGLNLVLQLTAIQSTSQGEARLPIRLKIDENVLQTMDSRPLALHLVQHLSSAGDSIISHTLWWNPLSNSASYVDDYVVLVYNSTHVMQTEAKERQISLSNLSPGTVYKMCVVQADTVCRGVEWSCLTSILPLHRNDLVPSPGADVRHLSVLAVDAASVQLLWLPPARSTRTANIRAPRFYFIVLLPGRELRSCSLQTFYVQAPWSQPADYQRFTELASAALSQFMPESCLQKRPKPVQLYPVGVWPDWEKYDEQLDGWGRVGDFVVTIDGLTPNQEYSLHLSPIYSESYGEMTTTRFSTTSLGDGCDLRLESANGKESRLIWRVPTYIMRRISPMQSFVFQIDVERIGRPPLETLTDMCFVKSCTMGTASKPQFQPQSANEAQRVLCQRSQVPLDPIHFEQVIQLSCLLPCVVYQINVTLLSNDLGDPEGFSCQRRVIRPGQAPRPMSNLRASALSHDMILIHLDKEQHISTHDYCAPVGYAIRLSDPTTLESTTPMLLTLEDLAGGSHLPLVSPSWTSDDSSYNMLLTHPLVNATKLHLTVESFATSMSPGVKADVNLRNLESSCQADCLWPSIAPFTLFHSITGRDYRGQYASYRSMRESRHQLFQCGRSLTSARKQMTRCMAPNGFILSNQAYCQSEDGFNFCAIPRCNEMALLPCVPELQMPLINSTEVRLVWTAPESPIRGLPPPSGFVASLSETPMSVEDTSLRCVQTNLLLSDEASGLDAHGRSPFIDQLLSSCPSRGQSVIYRGNPETTFGDLKQNTSYELRITAFDDKGLLGATWLHVLRTIPAAPCKPQNVFISRVESRALSLNWSVPTGKACGSPTGVFIHYHLHGRDQDRPEPLRLPPDTTTRLARLEPCQTYCMQVQFVNDVRAGPVSDKLCLATRRPAFTRPPSVVLSLIRDSVVEATPNDFVTCQLDIHLDYTKTCPVQFQVEFGVYNSPVREQRLFHRTEIFISDRFHIGLFYQLRVRALSPDYVGKLGSFPAASPVSFHDSGWSAWLDLFTGMDHFKITNISVDVQPPTLAKDMALCVPKQPSSQSTEDWNSYVRRVILSDPDDLCIQVRWAIDGQTRGLVGLLVVVLAERPPERSTTVRHPQNMTKVYEGIQRSLKDCIRMLWVPCDNCLGPYSLINAHQQVWNRLFQLVDLCDSTFRADGLTSPTNRGLLDSSSPFANTNSPSRTDELLKLLARSTTTRILLNQTTVDLLLKVSKNIVIEEADLSILSPRFSRSAVQFPPQPAVQNRFRITDIEQGIVQFYMVSANNVTLLAHQQWRLPSKGSASGQMNAGAIAGLIFGILFVLGLLAALSLLIVFNAKRVNRMRHSALQRVEDYGGLADSDDEEAAMCLEMKQPILPPKIAKFLMRPPDPISVHEFTLWCSRHSLNDYQSLRQEFKHLQIHAMRQEQAKRLTRQVGQRPENRLRNKYRNLVPFDHNYVHLLKSWRMVDIIEQPTPTNCPTADASANHCEAPPVEKVETASLDSDNKLLTEEHWIASDYVNASLVPGRAPGIAYCLVQSNLLPRTYIAAQAPVKQTRVLFWQMIWDHGVKLILTLTRLVEGPKEKCVQYWPGPADDAPSGTDSSDEKVLQLGHFTITLLQCVSNAAVVKRKFSVQNSLVSGGPPRIVVQLHMMRWPDFSAPSPVDFTSLLFTYWTERRCTSSDAPVLIHCSAGIGRTGTFICLDQLCHQARYYLQPDFQPWNMHPTCKSPTNLEEPVYVNLKFDSEETANSSANNHRVSGLSAAASEPCGDEYPNGGSQTTAGLLSGATRNNDTRSNTARRRRFGLGRRKSHCIDIYKIVLWLRSNRSYMVQSEEQYLFIYQYLSYFIQKVNDSEQIYVNV